MIRILSWNTNHWQRKHQNEAFWRYLAYDLCPDIAILQEVRPIAIQGFLGQVSESKLLGESDSYTWEECGHNWGTGIFTAGLPLRPINIQASHKGCLSCAEVLLPGEGLIVISLYARLEDGKSIKVIHRLISDLTDLLNKYRKKSNIILAGDFNAGLEWDKRQGNNSHRIMFERIEDFGLTDVLKNAGPVQTWRCDKSKVKWQIDYMFVSDKLNKRVNSAKVLYTPEIEKLSDHNPIELILAPALSGSG